MNNLINHKILFIYIFLGINLINIYPSDNFLKICQFGNYHSFDSMNSSIVDLRFGVKFEYFYLKNKFPLIETLYDTNCVFAFQESNEPFVKIVPGIGLNILVRINLVPTLNERIFIEGGYGLISFVQPYPDGGTYLNGARQLGFGYNTKNDYFIVCRWYHNSNADIAGRDKNPGLDTIGFSFGKSFK